MIPTAKRAARIDIATGAIKAAGRGPRPEGSAVSAGGSDIGYLRRDGADQGIFYASGKRGPKGADIRVPVLVAGRQAGRL